MDVWKNICQRTCRTTYDRSTATLKEQELGLVVSLFFKCKSLLQLFQNLAGLVQTFSAKAMPDIVAKEDKIQYLKKVIKITLKAWPHSWPKTSRDYTNRWWSIGQEVSSLKTSITWIQDNLSVSFERVPQLYDLSTDVPFVRKATYMFDLIYVKKKN
jgi:hypothetical protein